MELRRAVSHLVEVTAGLGWAARLPASQLLIWGYMQLHNHAKLMMTASDACWRDRVDAADGLFPSPTSSAGPLASPCCLACFRLCFAGTWPLQVLSLRAWVCYCHSVGVLRLQEACTQALTACQPPAESSRSRCSPWPVLVAQLQRQHAPLRQWPCGPRALTATAEPHSRACMPGCASLPPAPAVLQPCDVLRRRSLPGRLWLQTVRRRRQQACLTCPLDPCCPATVTICWACCPAWTCCLRRPQTRPPARVPCRSNADPSSRSPPFFVAMRPICYMPCSALVRVSYFLPAPPVSLPGAGFDTAAMQNAAARTCCCRWLLATRQWAQAPKTSCTLLPAAVGAKGMCDVAPCAHLTITWVVGKTALTQLPKLAQLLRRWCMSHAAALFHLCSLPTAVRH